MEGEERERWNETRLREEERKAGGGSGGGAPTESDVYGAHIPSSLLIFTPLLSSPLPRGALFLRSRSWRSPVRFAAAAEKTSGAPESGGSYRWGLCAMRQHPRPSSNHLL